MAVLLAGAAAPAIASPDDPNAVPGEPVAEGPAVVDPTLPPEWEPAEQVTAQADAEAEEGGPALTPADGSVLSRVQTITASPLEGDPVESLSLDGEQLDTASTLGQGETSSFQVNVGSNSMDRSYSNYLIVNGTRIAILATYASATTDIAIPYELLTYGENSITLGTGTRPTSCGINHDDFVLDDFRVVLADGTEVRDEANPDGLTLGDGNCGSTADRPRSVDLTFTIDGEPGEDAGLLHVLDTTSIEDGEHEITATTASGASATHTVTVDNSGPELVSSAPAAGDTLVGETTIAAELADPAGVADDVSLTLDGEEIDLGASISSDELVDGAHELVIEATDELGNESRHVVPFDSRASAPALGAMSPQAGTTGIDGAANLSVDVTDPNGSNVTTTFYSATPSAPSAAWQGEAVELPPSQLDFTRQTEAPVDALATPDGETLAGPDSESVSYQRFDVPVEEDASELVVSWNGQIDPARGVALSVWDVNEQTWDRVAESRGSVEGATELSASAGPEHVDDGVVHVLAQAFDPFADDIDEEPDGQFRDPETYDFSIAHLTDTQYYSEGAIERETEEERAMFADSYSGIIDWIIDNAEARNIAYTAHTGDITENNIIDTDDPTWLEQVRAEYEFASEQQARLDASGMPNGVLPGNHDNVYGSSNDLYNEYFGPERYEEIAQSWEDAEYGGPWREGDNSAHYDLFSAGGLDFIAVSLPFWVSDAQLTWAREILAQYPDRNGIVTSHAHLAASTSPDGRGAGHASPDGQRVYDEVIAQSPNVFLTLAGHIHGVATNVLTDVAEPGHNVVELLADYQAYTVDGERATGFFRLLQFDVERSEMTVDTYSPRLDNHGASEFDGSQRYDGREDEFTVPVNLSTRTTSIVTDSVSVATLGGEEIGSDTVTGEGTATAEWASLEEGTTYGWYAVAESETGGRSVSPVATFTTAGQPDDGEEPGEPVQPAPGRGYYLNNGWDGQADSVFEFGRPGDTALVGDWDGDGIDTIALRRGNELYLTNSPDGSGAEPGFTYGRAGDVLLAGDFDGDGADSFAVRRGNTYFAMNAIETAVADQVVDYGRVDDEVLVGDFDGNGTDTFAVRRGAQFFVANEIRGGWADEAFTYGRTGDVVLTGDWDGDGMDTFAVRRGNAYFVNNALTGGAADLELTYGRAGDVVLVGDWDGDGTDTLGVRR
jgi:hypothetical protein